MAEGQTPVDATPAYLTVMSWNVKSNVKFLKEDLEKTKEYLYGTVAHEKPALLLCQEVDADASMLPFSHLDNAEKSMNWIENDGKAALKKYRVAGTDSPSVSVWVNRDVLTVKEKDTKQSKGFPRFLNEEMQHWDPKKNKKSKEEVLAILLQRSVWVLVETTAAAAKRTFLVMSIHVPGTVGEKEHLSSAVLRAAFRLAVDEGLPLLVGGDWNTPVGGIVEYLGKDVKGMVRLLNDVPSRHRLDGFFLCNGGRDVGGEAATAVAGAGTISCKAYMYLWSSGNDDVDREVSRRSKAFRGLVAKWNSGDAEGTKGANVDRDRAHKFRQEACTFYSNPREHLPIMLKLAIGDLPAILSTQLPATLETVQASGDQPAIPPTQLPASSETVEASGDQPAIPPKQLPALSDSNTVKASGDQSAILPTQLAAPSDSNTVKDLTETMEMLAIANKPETRKAEEVDD